MDGTPRSKAESNLTLPLSPDRGSAAFEATPRSGVGVASRVVCAATSAPVGAGGGSAAGGKSVLLDGRASSGPAVDQIVGKNGTLGADGLCAAGSEQSCGRMRT